MDDKDAWRGGPTMGRYSVGSICRTTRTTYGVYLDDEGITLKSGRAVNVMGMVTLYANISLTLVVSQFSN